MATRNQIDLPLSGSTGTGTFVGATAPTLVTPKIGTIADVNGVAIVSFNATGSAINNLSISNNSIGNPVALGVVGADTDVGISLTTKGTGIFSFNSANTSVAAVFNTGTALQHTTNFSFANTSATRTITWPDTDGTIAFTSTASGIVNSGTANQLTYYATTGTAVSGITGANNGVLVTNNSGVPSLLANSGTPGFVLTANSGAPPSWQAVSGSGTVNSGLLGQVAYYAADGTAVSGESLSSLLDSAIGSTQGDILYRNATTWVVLAPGTAGQFLQTQGAAADPSWEDVNVSGLTWSNIAGTTQAAVVNHGYLVTNSSATTITLPALCSMGDIVQVQGFLFDSGASNWIIQANTGQTISFGAFLSTTAGTLTSKDPSDSVQLVCVVANTAWAVNYAVSEGMTISN